MIDVSKYIKDNKLKIIVKPNSPSNEIISYDEERNALRVNIKAAPEKGKANIEVIRFFTKLLRKNVRIKSGLTSKEKVLEIKQ